jgi:hypothetical protein
LVFKQYPANRFNSKNGMSAVFSEWHNDRSTAKPSSESLSKGVSVITESDTRRSPPERIFALRAALYQRLVPIGNRWNQSMGIDVQYPTTHDEFIDLRSGICDLGSAADCR